ncbi:MAG: hypothetical protein ACO1N0_13455 [Fluviicola sp.]
MELSLKPSQYNRFPLNGILVKGPSVKNWMLEIQRMELNLNRISVYPLPGTTANSVWGCLIVPQSVIVRVDLEQNEICQQVSSTFFIANKSELFPVMTTGELEKLFAESVWLMHPEIGLVALKETLDVSTLITLPQLASLRVISPEPAPFVPKEIKSFQVAPVDVEKALEKLEEQFFPKREKMEDKPLSFFEKMKMQFYKLQFRKKEGNKRVSKTNSSNTSQRTGEPNGFGKLMQSLMKPFNGKKKGSYSDRVEENLEDLEKRNQKQLDKLLDMLRNNPDEALKYAIPLDETGSSRGQSNGRLELSKNWSIFSIFADRQVSGNRSGGAVDVGDYYGSLKEQYRKTATELIEQKNYEKAAFVYMKLLKDDRSAADTLAKGELYQDAASIYLKLLNDKPKAAECFVKGNLIANAIDLYKELKDHEKVGDMYTILQRKKEADVYYEQVAANHQESNQYIKASMIYKNKMQRNSSAQETLMKGWRADHDAVNCLKMYLSDFESTADLKKELNRLYQEDVHPSNREKFLSVLKNDDYRRDELEEPVREMAYEIIASSVNDNPEIVKELKYFNPENKGLIKDTLRYSIGRSGRK